MTEAQPVVAAITPYRVESQDHFTYNMDLSTDGGRSWNVGQIEMSFYRKE
jgi:hypothetical protein